MGTNLGIEGIVMVITKTWHVLTH